MQVIATIRTDFPTKFGIPRQSGIVDTLRAKIVFEPAYRNPDALGRNGERVAITCISLSFILWACLRRVRRFGPIRLVCPACG